ncbi:hypothetical protein EJB05_37292, partial [Eragrostis curvula]
MSALRQEPPILRLRRRRRQRRLHHAVLHQHHLLLLPVLHPHLLQHRPINRAAEDARGAAKLQLRSPVATTASLRAQVRIGAIGSAQTSPPTATKAVSSATLIGHRLRHDYCKCVARMKNQQLSFSPLRKAYLCNKSQAILVHVPI